MQANGNTPIPRKWARSFVFEGRRFIVGGRHSINGRVFRSEDAASMRDLVREWTADNRDVPLRIDVTCSKSKDPMLRHLANYKVGGEVKVTATFITGDNNTAVRPCAAVCESLLMYLAERTLGAASKRAPRARKAPKTSSSDAEPRKRQKKMDTYVLPAEGVRDGDVQPQEPGAQPQEPGAQPQEPRDDVPPADACCDGRVDDVQAQPLVGIENPSAIRLMELHLMRRGMTAKELQEHSNAFDIDMAHAKQLIQLQMAREQGLIQLQMAREEALAKSKQLDYNKWLFAQVDDDAERRALLSVIISKFQ